MSRWKYRTEKVTVGENSQTVRQLTAGERSKVVETRRGLAACAEISGRKGDPVVNANLQKQIVRMAATNPDLSDEDVDQMPADLLDACAAKIMDLTNGPMTDAEKKALDKALDEEQADS